MNILIEKENFSRKSIMDVTQCYISDEMKMLVVTQSDGKSYRFDLTDKCTIFIQKEKDEQRGKTKNNV